MHKNENFEVNL